MLDNGKKQVVTKKVKSITCLIHLLEILHHHYLGKRHLTLILSSLNNISSNIKLFRNE